MKRLLLFALLLMPLVAASNIVIDQQQQNACATDQLVLSGTIENTKSQADTFRMHVESDEGLSSYVTPELKIDGYGIGKFMLFLSPICLDLGDHEYTIVAESSRGEVISEKGIIHIDNCNLMDLSVTQEKQEVCNGESANFDVSVRNLGSEEQTFTLTTDLNPDNYELSKATFTLQPNAQGVATLKLNVPYDAYAKGLLTFKVNAQSTYSCGSNSKDAQLSIYVKRCDGLKVTALDTMSVQGATQDKWSVFFDNSKTADVYSLKTSCPAFVQLPTSTISLGDSESKSIDVLISPKVEDVGEYNCKLTATSQKFRNEFTASLKLSVVQDYNAKLDAPSEVTVCQGDSAKVAFKLLNAGKENKFTITKKGMDGTLLQTEVDAAEKSVTPIEFQTSDAAPIGTYNLEVTAASPYSSVKGSATVKVEDCFASGIKISDEKVEMCAGESIVDTVRVANRGSMEDSYVLGVHSPNGFSIDYVGEQAFRLPSGEKKEVGIKIIAPEEVASGTYNFEVKAAGTKNDESANFTVVVLPSSTCHSLILQADSNSMQTGAGVGKSFRIQVINKGSFTEKLELYLAKKPNWAYITPTSLEVLPGTKEEALVYFAPPLNEKLGEYPIVVEARGKYITQDLTLKVGVTALETATAEAKIDLSQTSAFVALEEDAEIPLHVTVKNTGNSDLTKATIFFSDYISVISQEPFDLKAGETKSIALIVQVEKGSEYANQTKLGVYAKEGSAEKVIAISVLPSAFAVSQVSVENGTDGFREVLSLKNSGNETLRLVPKALQSVNFSSSEIELKAGEEMQLTAIMKQGNETIYFEDAISGKVYRRRIEVSNEGNVTGLFLLSLQKVLPYLVAIIGGVLALYLIVSRRTKLMERIDGKKEDIDGPGENSTYEEEEIPEEDVIRREGDAGFIKEPVELEATDAATAEKDMELEKKIGRTPLAATTKSKKAAEKAETRVKQSNKTAKRTAPKRKSKSLRGLNNFFFWSGE